MKVDITVCGIIVSSEEVAFGAGYNGVIKGRYRIANPQQQEEISTTTYLKAA